MEPQKPRSRRNWLLKAAKTEYGTEPEHPWTAHPDGTVLRHKNSKKCYAVLMSTSYRSLGLDKDGRTDAVNLKTGPVLQSTMLQESGVLPAYHMSRGQDSWVTVLLDGSASSKTLRTLLALSYDMTSPKKKSGSGRRITDWIIPANPRYFDMEQVMRLDDEGTFLFKQSSSICVGDGVYIYVAAPVSGICYRCEAVKTDIPEVYEDEHVRISRLMRLKLLQQFDPPVSLSLMREYGAGTVRGPRGIPIGLKEEIAHRYPKKK